MNRVLTLGGVADSTSAQSSLLREPSTSLALQKATNQNHAQKFPISLSVLKPPAQTGLNPSGRFSCRFRSHHPLAAALSFRIWGTLSSASMQWFSKTYTLLHLSWWGPGRHSSKRVTSLYVLRRSPSLQLRVFSHRSAPSISHKSVLCRPVPTAPSALPWSSLV